MDANKRRFTPCQSTRRCGSVLWRCTLISAPRCRPKCELRTNVCAAPGHASCLPKTVHTQTVKSILQSPIEFVSVKNVQPPKIQKNKTKYNLGKHTPGDNVIRSDLYKGVWTFTGTVLLLWRFKKGAAPQSCWFESKDRMVWDVGFPKFELPSTELRPVFYHLFIHSSDKKTNRNCVELEI